MKNRSLLLTLGLLAAAGLWWTSRRTGATPRPQPAAPTPDGDPLDVLIVGAGLSGIGAARHLLARSPGQTFEILEARHAIGGTWDLFRYPGVRSDSDVHTLGYSFKPWEGNQSIADGHDIRAYIREAADEAGVTRRVRFGQRVTRADWSTPDALWTVTSEHQDEDGTLRTTSRRALSVCASRQKKASVARLTGTSAWSVLSSPSSHSRVMRSSSWSWRRLTLIGTRSSRVSVPWISRLVSSKVTYSDTAGQACPSLRV